MRRIAVVRVRGGIGVKKEILDTLAMLGLKKVNHCVIVDDRPSYMGMIKKVENFVTYGYIDEKTLATILRRRGELEGGGKLTDEYVRENTRFNSIDEFAKAFINFEAELSDIPKLKKVFRLHPPRKGYKNIKRHFKEGGALGFRGEKINELLYRMR